MWGGVGGGGSPPHEEAETKPPTHRAFLTNNRQKLVKNGPTEKSKKPYMKVV